MTLWCSRCGTSINLSWRGDEARDTGSSRRRPWRWLHVEVCGNPCITYTLRHASSRIENVNSNKGNAISIAFVGASQNIPRRELTLKADDYIYAPIYENVTRYIWSVCRRALSGRILLLPLPYWWCQPVRHHAASCGLSYGQHSHFYNSTLSLPSLVCAL